jgi:predicted permease
VRHLLQDLRFAIRQMRRTPGFALTAVLTLTFGIAANLIVFAVMQAMILEPIDVPNAKQVMSLSRKNETFPAFSWSEVRDIRDGSSVFSSVGAYCLMALGLEAKGATHPVWSYEVSGDYFQVTGIKPYLGRLLNRADDSHPGASQAAVLSWTAWNSYFAADPGVVGTTVRVNKQPYTIVGVTPQGFYGTEKEAQPDIFVPLANQASLNGMDWLESRNTRAVWAILRLKDGVTQPQWQADLDAIAERTRRQYPKEEDQLSFKLTKPGLMGDFLGGPARAFLSGVLFLAGILLLATCANLGSLFAARTADRTREIAIRMAVGSTRWRVVQQIIVEAVLIALLGGACGAALTWAAIDRLGNWHPPTEYPLRFHVAAQPSLLLVTLLVSVFAGLAFGVMPLAQILKADPNEAIKGTAAVSPAGRRWPLREVLLTIQIALCCVTVTAAFVSLRGLEKSLTMNMGFDPNHAVMTKFMLSQAGYSPETAAPMQRQIMNAVAHLPGVVSVAYANATPLSQDTNSMTFFALKTTDYRESTKVFESYFYQISPGYFAAAGTVLLEGRDISFADAANTPLVAVVNQQFARSMFHTEHAVGQYFKNSDGKTVQVVGIVADGKYFTLSEERTEAAFFPILQRPSTSTSLIVRMRPDASDLAVNEMANAVRKTVHDIDPAIPLRISDSWNRQLGLTFFVSQEATVTLGIFGAFGLLLSVAGTFGLASYTVSKRLRELSIRVALGAQAKEVLSAALGRMVTLLTTGALAGMVLGAAASKLLAAIVYQASAQDPVVLAAVAVTMFATGVLSVAGPVRRTLHIDPATLLRDQ